MKEMPVYALVAGRNGTTLKESADADRQWSLGVKSRNYQAAMRKVALDEIISAISSALWIGRLWIRRDWPEPMTPL